MIPWRRLRWGKVWLIWVGLSAANAVVGYFVQSVVNQVVAFLLLVGAAAAGVMWVRERVRRPRS